MSNISKFTPKVVQTVPMRDTENRSFSAVITVVGCFAAALVMYNMKYSETFQTLEVDMVAADDSLVKQADTIAVAIAQAKTVGEAQFAVKSPPKTEKLRKPIERKTMPKKSRVEQYYTGKAKPSFKDGYVTGETVHFKKGDTENYIKYVLPFAKKVREDTNIPVSAVLAQIISESGSGSSYLAKNHNNHFGYKCSENCKRRGHCVRRTDDKNTDRFKHYVNLKSAFADYTRLLKGRRYAKVRKTTNGFDAVKELQNAGYATDRNYATALSNIIRKYNLTQYDK